MSFVVFFVWATLHQLVVPVAHFSASIPKGSVDSSEVPESFVFESSLEVVSVHTVTPHNVECILELRIQ